MAWTIEISGGAEKSLGKLDRQTRRRIATFIDSRLNGVDNPRRLGKALHASLDQYWSYRVGDYRLLCELHDEVLKVMVIKIGHRSDVYR